MKSVLLLALILFSSCALNNKNTDVTKRLSIFLTQQLQGNKGFLSLNNYKDIKWDKVYILPPYTNYQVLDTTLLEHQTTIDGIGIASRDDISVLMFFYKESLTGSAIVSTKFNFNGVNVFKNNKLRYFQRKDAYFGYVKNVEGFFLTK